MDAHDRASLILRALLSTAISFWLLFSIPVAGAGGLPAGSAATGSKTDTEIVLPGHVLPMLRQARFLGPFEGSHELLLTIVLRRDDQRAFDSYLHDLYDPKSATYRQFLDPQVMADRFGPSRTTYDELLEYLQASGFAIVRTEQNRQTISVRGTRTAAHQAFSVEIDNYLLNGTEFFANRENPLVPAEFAGKIEAIIGMSSYSQPRPVTVDQALNICSAVVIVFGAIPLPLVMATAYFAGLICTAGQIASNPSSPSDYCGFLYPPFMQAICAGIAIGADPPFPNPFGPHNPPPATSGMGMGVGQPASSNLLGATSGVGQIIGITTFSDFNTSDVEDWLAVMALDPMTINHLTRIEVNGGATNSSNETEVLLDIAAVWSMAKDASIRVYEAPFTGPGNSFQALFNAMINDGVHIISNSFAYCENNTSLADVTSINSILQTAAAAGISVFSASGDRGSSCLNGSPNTAHVPSSSPNLTAVGGSRLTFGPGFTYGNEIWWNGTHDVPPTGQGGFGVSAFFNRPSYQNGHTGSSMRSIPDVVVNADPATGFILCQANDGGCPTGKLYGGTSVAAPIWAGFTAQLNEANGANLGFLNPLIYPHAGTEAFHDAASMGSDFAHVGLGSPNLDVLFRQLLNIPEGSTHATFSQVHYAGSILGGAPGFPVQGIPADGSSAAVVVATLRDAGGHTISGHAVALATDSSDVEVTPTGTVVTDSNGQAAFELRNLQPEIVTVTITDTHSATVLNDEPIIPFGVPPAASAGISAFPTTLDANGVATTAITVTLLDGLGRPAPGKEVLLSQGAGRSKITTPVPPVTDSNGEIVFTASNVVNQVVEYTATVVTDIRLPVPGSAQVTFQNGIGGCGSDPEPVGVNGYTVTPYLNGFNAGPLFYGNINFGNCNGASLPIFRNERLFIANSRTGDIFEFGVEGGVAAAAIANQGATLAVEAVGKDGKLYARRVATTGNFNTGDIVELDPHDGSVVRTVVSNLKCPHSLTTDPLSGDLFIDTSCFGIGSDDATIRRVRNPASISPSVETYTTLAKTPNGRMSFAPDGTLFVVMGYLDAQPAIVQISGTDGPVIPTIETVPDVYSYYWVSVVAADSNGQATSLALLQADGLNLVDITESPPVKTVIAEGIGPGMVGADGCLYGTLQHTVYRMTDPAGGCSFLASGVNPTLRLSLDPGSPAPVQGSSQQLIATARYFDPLEDILISFQVNGANNVFGIVRTAADGTAEITYPANFAGTDSITATAILTESEIVSNTVEISLASGPHRSFLSLNQTGSWGTPGVPFTVSANLVDISLEPSVPIVGETVHFSMGISDCNGVTDAGGRASCQLTPSVIGSFILEAIFDGNAGFTPASDSITFDAYFSFLGDYTIFKDSFETPP